MTHAFHRFPYRNKLDLTGLKEYAVIHEDFTNADRFFELGEIEGYPKRNWTELAQKRLSHIGFMRRIDLTASGLCHLAYYSDSPRLYHGMMFCMPGLGQKEARQLALWFDSSLNLLQMLVSRIPARGGWTEYHRNTVEKFHVPDPTELNEQQQQTLEDAFSDIRKVEFPSIAAQLIRNTDRQELTNANKDRLANAFPDLSDELGAGFVPRRRLDQTVLGVLGVPEERHDRILKLLYPALLNEVVSLKLMMR